MNESVIHSQPLAMRLRPKRLADYVGQQHLLAPGKALFQTVSEGKLHSMILWGPPGSGKTTLAEIIAGHCHAHIERLSAVLAGVKDIREVVARAQQRQIADAISTVLFVDEVHRFNKAQQDAFLPHVEQGTVTLIGATTENPSFQLNNALLSRCRVYVLKTLSAAELLRVIERALGDSADGYGERDLALTDQQQQWLVKAADGDARQCLNLLEMIVDFADEQEGRTIIDDATVKEVLLHTTQRFDHFGEYFYDQISALHKSVRGSDPDAALYWFTRMIAGGCDVQYIARRVVRMASEDIGNADPRALSIALNAWDAFDRLGSPEGELALAQAVIYLACSAKSNAVYQAFQAAQQEVKQQGTLAVPVHLRNAPTRLMKNLGYGKAYRYSHDEPDAYSAGQTYFPDEMTPTQYYHPVSRGLEIKIQQKLNHLKRIVLKG